MASTEEIEGVDREETTAAYRERPRPLGEWLMGSEHFEIQNYQGRGSGFEQRVKLRGIPGGYSHRSVLGRRANFSPRRSPTSSERK